MNPPIIHPTAMVHPKAELGTDVRIGPFAVIDEHVSIGAGTTIGSHAWITGWTKIGAGNKIHHGAVLGQEPQDIEYDGRETRLVIGANNVFREYVTVHRGALKQDKTTLLGDENYFMVGCHVGHNARIGNKNILANNVLLAGHVELENQIFIAGGSAVHQFVRIGSLAIIRGIIAVGKDVPPYMMVTQVNYVGGLNTIGLRRAGISSPARTALKEAFRTLYRSGLNVSQALEKIRAGVMTVEVVHLVDFISGARRGICAGPQSAGEENQSLRDTLTDEGF